MAIDQSSMTHGNYFRKHSNYFWNIRGISLPNQNKTKCLLTTGTPLVTKIAEKQKLKPMDLGKLRWILSQYIFQVLKGLLWRTEDNVSTIDDDASPKKILILL